MNINEQNYVDEAEKAILRLKEKKDRNGKTIPMVTTSKIRNLLAMTADIYNEIMNQNAPQLDDEMSAKIEYLRVRFMYEAGREKSVYNFITETSVIELLKSVKKDKKQYILYNRYMEALVAFHKFYGGQDE